MKKVLLAPLALLFVLAMAVFPMSHAPVLKPEPTLLQMTQGEKDFKAHYLSPQYYEGVGGLKNYYARINEPQNPIANPLVLVTGLEDITENWWLTAQKALDQGFRDIYIIELRAQGYSQRLPDNSNNSIYVKSFASYSEDLVRALQDIDKKFGHPVAPPFLIAHSTGTLVVADSLDGIHNQLPAWKPGKLSFWAPLVVPSVSPLLNNPLVKPLLWSLDWLGEAMGRTVLGKRFPRRTFEENHVTTSRERFEWTEAVRFSSQQNSSGVSLRWALETFPVAEKHLLENYKSVRQPCLVLVAEDDLVVKNDWVIDNKSFVVEKVANARHALHIEKLEIFDPLLKKTFDFFLSDEL